MAVTYWHSARPILSTSKTGPSKYWKIFPLQNGCLRRGVWGLKKKCPLGILHGRGGNGCYSLTFLI